MKNQMTREQVIDLLYYLGASKVVNKEGKSDVQFTCTVHGENNPSAGFNLDKMCFNCFSCHASGGVEWLVMKSMPEDFKSIYDVDRFIKSRYNVDLSSVDISQVKELRRYGETPSIANDFEAVFKQYVTTQVKTRHGQKLFLCLLRMLQRFELYCGNGFKLELDNLTNEHLTQFEAFLNVEHTFFGKNGKCLPRYSYIYIKPTPCKDLQNLVEEIVCLPYSNVLGLSSIGLCEPEKHRITRSKSTD